MLTKGKIGNIICLEKQNIKGGDNMKPKIKYNYSKLLGRLTEYGLNRDNFADKIGIKRTSLYKRLESKVEFKQSEIQRAVFVLGLTDSDIPEYFFNTNV